MNSLTWNARLLILVNLLLIGGWSILLWVANTASRQSLAEAKENKEQLYQQFPPKPANPLASDLEAFGQDITDSEIPSSLQPYLKEIVETTENSLPDIPEALIPSLDAQQQELRALRDRLAEGEPLDWGMGYDIRTISFTTHLPSFLNRWNVFRLMLVQAIRDDREGKTDKAFLTLKALTRLADSFSHQPDITAQLISLNAHRDLLAVLRQLDDVPQEIYTELNQTVKKLETSMLNGIQFEGHINTSVYQEDYLLERTSPIGGFLWLLATPYLNLVAAETWDNHSKMLQVIRGAEVCEIRVEELRGTIQPTRWNFINYSKMIDHSFISFWVRVKQFQFALELTEKVQQVKTQTRRQGQFPQRLTGIEISSCPGSQWRYQVNPDGTATLDLEGIPPVVTEFGPDSFLTHYKLVNSEQ